MVWMIPDGGVSARTPRAMVAALFAGALIATGCAAMKRTWEFQAVPVASPQVQVRPGRIGVAHLVWQWSVGILGVAAILFAVWIPLGWWVTALMACGVGMMHWWGVVTWRLPVSRYFHQTAITLFVALPVTVLLIAAAGAGIRHVVARRRGVARTGGGS